MPPVGPAIPLIATPTFAPDLLKAPETICPTISSLTAPKLSKSDEETPKIWVLAS